MALKARMWMGVALGAVVMGGAAVTAGVHAKTKADGGATRQVVTGPIAEYWISTTTSTGMSLGGMSGGGRPSMSSIMGMMKGGNGPSYSMHLQLGSSQTANGDPAADHLPPAALDVGNDLPLYYKPPGTQKSTYTPTERSEPQQQETPKGKILIYWGCGEHAPKSQPVVIDLSKLTDPTERMGMMSKMMPVPMALEVVHAPSPDRFKSYGEWPNEKSRAALDGNSSLVGAHTIKGNYSPEIDFTLDRSQDFLAPIVVSGNQKDQDGAVPLAWTQIPNARGFFATAIGAGGEENTVVMWTSASSQISAMGAAFGDYITPHDAERLVHDKVLLPGEATTCTVPAEVAGAARGMMYSLTAFGGETNLAYPPRPEDPSKPWNIQWTTKVRYKSTTGGILGQTMGGGGMGGMFGGGSRGDDSSGSSSSSSSSGNQQKKKGGFGGFGDMLKQGASMIGGG